MNRTAKRMGKAAWPLLCIVGSLNMGAHAATTSLTVSMAYDYAPASGLLVKEVVEPGGGVLCAVSAYEYDAYGNRSKSTQRNCDGSAGGYPGSSAALNGEAAAPAAGSLALFATRVTQGVVTYNADGSVQVVATNAEGDGEIRVYGAGHGQPTKLIGPNGGITQWAYDALGRKVLEKLADGTGTRWSYDYCVGANNGQANCAAVGGIVPAYVITQTPLRGPLDLANPASTGTVNGRIGKVYQDVLGRVLRGETSGFDGTAIYVDTVYDNLGRVQKVTRPYYAGQAQYFTTYEYDKLGRVTKVSTPDGGSTTTTYSGLATTVSVVSSAGVTQTTVTTLNEAGRVATVKDANNKILTHHYDPLGNLQRTVDSAGNQINIGYDIRSRKTSMQDPDAGASSYQYNAAGNLVWQQDAKGQVTSMGYNKLGQLTSMVTPSLSTTWSYGKYADGGACANGKGQLCEASANNGYSRKSFYDATTRLIKATTKVGAKTFDAQWTYDSDGRLQSTAYPSGALTLQNIYNARGYLHKVVDAGNVASVYWRADSQDASQNLLQQTYGNGVSTTHAYFAGSGRLKSTVAGTGNAVQNIAYTYDLLGNLKTRNDALTGVNASYGYDSLNRLTNETRSGGGLTASQAITWSYDDIGNITARSDVGTYAYPASGAGSVHPHAVSGITGTVNGLANPTYAYDANGNLTTVATGSNVRTVAWNSADMVDSITQVVGGNTNRLAYLYGSEMDRAQETYTRNNVLQRTTTYLNLGGQLLYEEDQNNVSGVVQKKHYLNAGGRAVGVLTWDGSAWDTKYWHRDHLGSLMVTSNAAGAVVERLAYEPFGKRRNASGQTDAAGTLTSASSDRGYTEHEMMDEVGLVNMNGRIYDPAIGRFLSADPLIASPTYMQAYNRYAYVYNNPLGFIDPSGYLAYECNLEGERISWCDLYYGDGGLHVKPINGPGDGTRGDTGSDSNWSGGGSVGNGGWGSGAIGGGPSGTFVGGGVIGGGTVGGGAGSGGGNSPVSLVDGTDNSFAAHALLGIGGTIPFVGIVFDGVELGLSISELPSGKSTGTDVVMGIVSMVTTIAPGPIDTVVGAGKVGVRTARGAADVGREATGFLGRSGHELKNAPYQKVRNEATQINGRDFSGHALDQMQNRGVMPSVVENALNTGARFATRDGTTGYYDAINNIRVIVNSQTGRVVTVIRGAP